MCFHYFMAMFNEIVGEKMNGLSDAMGMAKNGIHFPAQAGFETAR